jgi:hypothetical protein
MKGYCEMPYGYLTDPQLSRDFWAIYTVEPDEAAPKPRRRRTTTKKKTSTRKRTAAAKR